MAARPFEYGESQEMLRASARKLVAERFPVERVRALMEEPEAHDRAAWSAMAELGWHGLLLPEELGGVGAGLLDLGVLLEELGGAVVPGPYLSAQLAVRSLIAGASDEQAARWFPAVADGSCIPTLALFESGGYWDPAAGGLKATRSPNDYLLSGAKVDVLDAGVADLLVVSAMTGVGPTLFAVERTADGVRVEDTPLADETRRAATVRFDNVKLSHDARIGEEGGAGAILDASLPCAWSALAAEMLGAARRVFRITVEYAQVREQFGRPIGGFQGVKHRLVDRMVELEKARSLVYGALWAQDHEPERARDLARMAKAYLSEVGPEVADTAVRVHGGIGFTWECDVHLYWKRLHWARHAFGDAPFHRSALARALESP